MEHCCVVTMTMMTYCSDNEIIMPAEHSGVIMEMYKWKVIIMTPDVALVTMFTCLDVVEQTSQSE